MARSRKVDDAHRHWNGHYPAELLLKDEEEAPAPVAHIGFFLTWAIDTGFASPEHYSADVLEVAQLRAPAITLWEYMARRVVCPLEGESPTRRGGSTMAPTRANGKICYLEIPTADISRSVRFYQAVFGWQIRRRGDGATRFDDGVSEVSGAWVTGRPASPVPGLLLYVMVDSISATVAAVIAHGGRIRPWTSIVGDSRHRCPRVRWADGLAGPGRRPAGHDTSRYGFQSF
jgi:predicted enzyme related to lactoylglutathione lyase